MRATIATLASRGRVLIAIRDRLTCVALLASVLSACISPALAADVTAKRLINADKEPHN